MSLVLVTGGAGFIGSNLAAALASQGFDVAVCDRLRLAESGKWRNLSKHPIVDLVDPDTLFDWLESHRGALEAVVHMGAISSTTEADADLILAVNFTLSKQVWRWCAQSGVRLVYASSAATYGDGSQGFEDRDDLPFLTGLRPLNAYGWSKALFDAYARRSADKGAAPPQWAGLKFFNVYGPNEYHKGPMRSVVAQIWPRAKSGASVDLFRSHHPDYADGGQLRDFIYVKDVEAIVLWLLDRPDVSGVFNAGTGAARSFLDLAGAVFHAAAMSPAVAFVDTPEAIRDRYQYFTQADTRRLRRAGYARAFTSLEDGVADYVTRYLSADDPYR